VLVHPQTVRHDDRTKEARSACLNAFRDIISLTSSEHGMIIEKGLEPKLPPDWLDSITSQADDALDSGDEGTTSVRPHPWLLACSCITQPRSISPDPSAGKRRAESAVSVCLHYWSVANALTSRGLFLQTIALGRSAWRRPPPPV